MGRHPEREREREREIRRFCARTEERNREKLRERECRERKKSLLIEFLAPQIKVLARSLGVRKRKKESSFSIVLLDYSSLPFEMSATSDVMQTVRDTVAGAQVSLRLRE